MKTAGRVILILLISAFAIAQVATLTPAYIGYRVNPARQKLAFYWKDDQGKNFRDFMTLQKWLKSRGEKMVFAMNGGMFREDLSPLGLYVEKGITLNPVNKVQEAYGNFYLQPNGVFYLTTDHKAVVCTTKEFLNDSTVQYATQSGPMLVIDGNIHPAFREGSKNLNIRNGVGVLPNGDIWFAMSTDKVNLYDFAMHFKEKGCKNALYLDGFVSRTYLPSMGWTQSDGTFGVIIAETE